MPQELRGLVVQGGAMRAIYSMAALQALADNGDTSSRFDLIVAASAGALNASLFVSDRAAVGTSLYLDKLSDGRFINTRRLHRIVDVDYLIDEVVMPAVPDLAEHLAIGPRFLVPLTEHPSGRAACIDLQSVSPEISPFEVLRATCAIPVLYNRPVDVGPRRYVDGGVTDPLPVARTLLAGCSELVVITTRPLASELAGLSLRDKLAVALWPNVSRPIRRLILAPRPLEDLSNELLSTVGGITWIAPSDAGCLVDRTTTERSALERCVNMAHTDVMRAMDTQR